MKIALKGGRSAAESDISALEAVIGKPLDGQFRVFVETYDGAHPEENSFTVDDVAHMGGVNEFIAVKDIVRKRGYIDDIAPGAYPVAVSAGGNYVILDQDRHGAIFFWDHEIEGGLSKLADSFDAFLDMIAPLDASAIQPTSGKVIRAWIDPDFLKQLDD